MTLRSTTYAILATGAVVLFGTILLLAPAAAQAAPAFRWAVGGVALAFGGIAIPTARAAGSDRSSAAFWFRAAPMAVAAVWVLVGFGLCMGAAAVTTTAVVATHLIGGGAWAVVTLALNAAASGANCIEAVAGDANAMHQRASDAATDLRTKAAGGAYALRAELVHGKVTSAPRKCFSHPTEAERLVQHLEALYALAISEKSVDADAGFEDMDRALRALGLR